MLAPTVRIAVFSDVHGNADALEAVLTAIDAIAPQQVFALGDHVGRGPDPARVLELLDAREIPRLRGNWEEWVARGDAGTPKRAAWVQAARGVLKKKALARMMEAPETMAVELGGHRVVLAHGSPRGITDRLTGCTPDDQLREAISGTAAEVVAVGHSHHAFVRRIDGTLVVNCGSVGYAVVGDPRACFAVIDLSPGVPPSAELVRVPYGFGALRKRMEKAKKRGEISPELARGWLRALLGNGEEPRDPLSLADGGDTLLVKLLARPSRGVYRALAGRAPVHADVLRAALELREALLLCEGSAPKGALAQARRRLQRLIPRLERAVRCAALAERVPAAAVRSRRATRALHRAARRKKMLAHGLDLVELMMSPKGHGDFERLVERQLRRRERASLLDDEYRLDRLERLAALLRVLGRDDTSVSEQLVALRELRISADASAFVVR